MTEASKTLPALRMGAAEWGMLAVLSLLWGATFFFAKIAVREVPTFTLVLARVSIAAAILAAVIVASGGRFPNSWRSWRDFFVMGLLSNVVPFSLIFYGQVSIGAGLAAVLNAVTPLSGAVIAHYLTDDEKLSLRRVLGVGIGVAGVAVLIGPSSVGTGTAALIGSAAVLAGGVSYGFSGVWGRRFRGQPALTSACCQLMASSLMMTPLVLAVDRPWMLATPGVPTILAVLGLAAFSTALAYVLYYAILSRAGSSNVLLVTLLIPISAAALGIAFLGESLHTTDILGAVLVGLALLVIDGRLVRMLTKAAPAS